MEITEFITSKPETLWLIVVIGAVAVIGIVDFLKHWINKKASKWIVFFVSLAVAFVLSPLVNPLITTIVILWLLILAVSTLARNAIVDGLPNLVSKAMGNAKKDGGEK